VFTLERATALVASVKRIEQSSILGGGLGKPRMRSMDSRALHRAGDQLHLTRLSFFVFPRTFAPVSWFRTFGARDFVVARYVPAEKATAAVIVARA